MSPTKKNVDAYRKGGYSPYADKLRGISAYNMKI